MKLQRLKEIVDFVSGLNNGELVLVANIVNGEVRDEKIKQKKNEEIKNGNGNGNGSNKSWNTFKPKRKVKKRPRSSQVWTIDEDRMLVDFKKIKTPISVIAKKLGRTSSSVNTRYWILKKRRIA